MFRQDSRAGWNRAGNTTVCFLACCLATTFSGCAWRAELGTDRYTVPETPYVVLERGDIRAVIVNNEPADDDVLAGHRGGYSGLASLTR